MEVIKSLLVTDSSSSWAGNFKLNSHQTGSISLTSEFGTDELSTWDTSVDSPKVEQHIDGLSIRIGFKRFIVDPSVQRSTVDEWIENIAIHEATVTSRTTDDVAADVSRLTAMFQNGQLTADEFALLVAKASGSSVNQSQTQSEERLRELDSRADLAEYQRLWLAVFPSHPMPMSLDPAPLIHVVHERRREMQRLPSDWFALSNLVGEYHNLNLLAKGQIANEISRAIKKGKPLPPIATSSIQRLRSEMNAVLQPFREFGKKMNWPDIPMV